MTGIDPIELAKAHANEALGVCIDAMRDKYAPHADKLKAAGMLLERALGRTVTPLPAAPGKRTVAKQLAGMNDSDLLAVLTQARALRTGGGGIPPAAGTLTGGVHEGSPIPLAHTSERSAPTPVGTALDEVDLCS